MTMPSRNYQQTTTSSYRYSFNGKEKDDDINLGAIAFEARIYESRIGRFFSTDPREKEYAWQSTYVYFSNCPTSVLDVLGMGGNVEPPTESSEPPTRDIHDWEGTKENINFRKGATYKKTAEAWQLGVPGTRHASGKLFMVEGKYVYHNEYWGSTSEDKFFYYEEKSKEWVSFTPVGYQKVISNPIQEHTAVTLWNGTVGAISPIKNVEVYINTQTKATLEGGTDAAKLKISTPIVGTEYNSNNNFKQSGITPQDFYIGGAAKLPVGEIDFRFYPVKYLEQGQNSTEVPSQFRLLYTPPLLSYSIGKYAAKGQIDFSADKNAVKLGVRGNFEIKAGKNLKFEANVGARATLQVPPLIKAMYDAFK